MKLMSFFLIVKHKISNERTRYKIRKQLHERKVSTL